MQMLPLLADRCLVLASTSPRRSQIMQTMGLTPEVVATRFIEDLDKSLFATPQEYVVANARGKAQEVYERLSKEVDVHDGDSDGQRLIVIGADTVVVLPGSPARILEKPRDKSHALEMLRSLRDEPPQRTHVTTTGVCIAYRQPGAAAVQYHCFYEDTKVTFGDAVTDAMLQAYVDSGDPLDKAGAYGYQSLAINLVSKIDGCYYNVVGLPAYRLHAELRAILTQ
ncbi:hypothetical protein RI367_005500 [Sorochytrium milnesiophthora]